MDDSVFLDGMYAWELTLPEGGRELEYGGVERGAIASAARFLRAIEQLEGEASAVGVGIDDQLEGKASAVGADNQLEGTAQAPAGAIRDLLEVQAAVDADLLEGEAAMVISALRCSLSRLRRIVAETEQAVARSVAAVAAIRSQISEEESAEEDARVASTAAMAALAAHLDAIQYDRAELVAAEEDLACVLATITEYEEAALPEPAPAPSLPKAPLPNASGTGAASNRGGVSSELLPPAGDRNGQLEGKASAVGIDDQLEGKASAVGTDQLEGKASAVGIGDQLEGKASAVGIGDQLEGKASAVGVDEGQGFGGRYR